MLNERFWSKVDKSAAGGCWNWKSVKNNNGYGLFSVNSYVGKKLAHRLAYEDINGKIPAGIVIRHACDNPACVNPRHLLAGTQRDNSWDACARDRFPHRRLTIAQVIRIRLAYVSGVPIARVLDDFGITLANYSELVSGTSWKHILGRHGCPSLDELRAAKRSTTGAKITLDDARDIRRRLAGGETGRALAREYGITPQTVSEIKLRKIWAD